MAGCTYRFSLRPPLVWFGFLSRCESVNVLQESVAQADLLTQSRDAMGHRRAEWPLNSQSDLTAMMAI